MNRRLLAAAFVTLSAAGVGSMPQYAAWLIVVTNVVTMLALAQSPFRAGPAVVVMNGNGRR